MNAIVTIVVLAYVGLWVAELYTAPTSDARRRIVFNFAETVAVAGVFGAMLWWLL